MFNIKTAEDAKAFIREDQDEAIADYVLDRLDRGEFQISFYEDDNGWMVRGDYHDLLFVSAESGCEVNDELLRRIFGTADPRLI